MTTSEKDSGGVKPNSVGTRPPGGDARVEGRASLEGADDFPAEMKLRAYVFDRAGQTLGTADVDAKGGFSVPVDTTQATGVQVVIGPEDDPQTIRKSAAFSQNYSAEEWQLEGKKLLLRTELLLPRDIWSLWWPMWICVTGHVRKKFQRDGVEQTCPVPFVKVEIFDVDREHCWWPFIRRWWDVVVDKPVIRIPDLLKERPVPKPFPWPEPGPDPHLIEAAAGPRSAFEAVALNPQPLPPRELAMSRMASRTAMLAQVGPTDADFAGRLDKLTLTSRIAPWLIFPWCFYSRQLICETTTDNCGYFRCCFRWWPFHLRRGRFRFDQRPDVIIKVTQIINGVETVIYLDPYTSTRWNVSSLHADLYVDNEDVQCGSCDDQSRPAGAEVFLTRIGNDEVYQINQADGTYASPSFPTTKNMAYGGGLSIFAQFGDTLSRALAIPGATAPYYYRLSRSNDGVKFTPITGDLSDTRVNKFTLFSESHSLGAQTVNGVPGLYEVRDFANYYWYNPDLIGFWDTPATESDTGTYTLRLEVFDATGAKLDSTKVNYRDGTVVPPTVLPPMLDRCDVRITLDNKPPTVNLSIPAVINDCGVVPWASAPGLTFDVKVAQENGRLHSWQLEYVKGVLSGTNFLAGGSSNTGAPASVNQNVSGAPLLGGLSTTCAFAVTLWAWAHVRNGYGLVYFASKTEAIAIEKCS